ncbi:MAG TPA: type IV toxin-antitoxin system AbiEi family antitoxin [Lacisediminihabitans sp.]|uniref:type IV toxin-antitoxin system AbiEi family antitoxin n=1 Tax=Lacisediminihabitans sp. TaxID=2787631 RepID=UPI002EDAA774
MPHRLPPVLSRHDLPAAELQAARLDGEVYAVDACFSPIDELERPATRAMALFASLPGRLIAEQRSAAWVLGALDRPPPVHQLCTDIGARVSQVGPRRAVIREVVIDEGDLIAYSGLRSTNPLRTAVDLARFSPAFGAEERRLVAGLGELGRFDLASCLSMLERRRNLPGKRLAASRLRSAIGGDGVGGEA